MAYTINGKVYTDHALMDEVVYNVKLILNDIVLKNENLANEKETEKSMEMSDYLIGIKNGSMEFSFFPFTINYLKEFGYNSTQAYEFVNDRSLIPQDDREELLKFCCNKFVEEYEEYNDYYRMLNGKPAYGTDIYNVYIDPNDPKILSLNRELDLNFDLPIHEYSQTQINTLDTIGILDDILSKYKGSKYQYLNHIGGKKIDIYMARIASNWDILYIPNVEFLVKSRFKELYTINRDIYQRRTYQDAYNFDAQYYNEMIMIMILCQTFTDIITELPEWYIRRDVFDLRTVEYFLSSQGIKFYKQIPLKYQIRIVKNMNKLIKYKSTNQNIQDILEIFSIEGTTVYKYYLYKKYLYTDHNIKYIGDEDLDNKEFEMESEYDFFDEDIIEEVEDLSDLNIYDFYDVSESEYDEYAKINIYDFINEDAEFAPSTEETRDNEEKIESSKIIVDENGNVYDLEFVRVPLGESFDDYIKDNINKESYDNVTYSDKYWDGEDTHSYIKNKHLLKDFSIEGTKYMFLDYSLDMEEYSYQMSYFLNMIFNSKINTNDIQISIPSIKNNALFSLTNICILLNCLSMEYIGKHSSISLPIYKTEPKPDFKKYTELNGGYPILDGGSIVDGQGPDINSKYGLNIDGGEVEYSEIIQESYSEWMRTNNPQLFVPTYNKVYGFNLTANMDELEKNISKRHSSFGFEKGYNLEDLGINNFITTNKIDTVEEMVNIYKENSKCYDKLNEIMKSANTRDDVITFKYVFNTLFTTSIDIDFYKLKNGNIANDYVELLEDKDYTLYNYYLNIMKESDIDIRKDNIRNILNEIVDTLEYYIGTDELKYVFSFVPTNSPDAIVEYISLMINFFKSWKTYFLDPKVTYILADKDTDKVNGNGDMITELKTSKYFNDQLSLRDSVKMKSTHYFEDFISTSTCEVIDMYAYHQFLVTDIIDYDGLYVDSESLYKSTNIDSSEIDGGNVEILLSNPYINVNAGNVAARQDIYDLDGGGPLDMREYLNIDGLNIKDKGNNYPLLNDFSVPIYIVDGGGVGEQKVSYTVKNITNNGFISNEVIISPKESNDIIINDGLYLVGDFVPNVNFEEFRLLMIKERQEYQESLINKIRDIKEQNGDNLAENIVKSLYEKYFVFTKEVLEDYNKNITSNYIKRYTDERVIELKNWFNDLNLFGWDYF